MRFQAPAIVDVLTLKPLHPFNLLPIRISYPMEASSDMDAHQSAERFDTMALYDQLAAVLVEALDARLAAEEENHANAA